MQFGLFGAAQAQRGGPDVDSAAGFKDYIEYVIEAEALGYQSITLPASARCPRRSIC